MLQKIKDNIIIHVSRFFYGYDAEDIWWTIAIIFVMFIMYAAYGVDPHDPA